MSELPGKRLKIGKPAFYHTSVDYFGPKAVVVGRNMAVKRYGALFTCMSTKAVYVEVAESLSSSDFLNALRRFISIRGCPETMYSDNGTNFKGAEAELREHVGNLNSQSLVEEFSVKKSMKWTFQPPSAPHWGGVHKSLVKSVKKAISKTLSNQAIRHHNLKEDELRTLMAEITGFLNSRPLTYVSSDARDLTILTPNHFLLQRASATVPPGNYETACPRNHYKFVQHVASGNDGQQNICRPKSDIKSG